MDRLNDLLSSNKDAKCLYDGHRQKSRINDMRSQNDSGKRGFGGDFGSKFVLNRNAGQHVW